MANWTYANHRWEMGRNGNRWRYMCTRTLVLEPNAPPWMKTNAMEITLATVTRNSDDTQPTFNRWFVNIQGSLEKVEPFWSKDEAMAYAMAVIKLNLI